MTKNPVKIKVDAITPRLSYTFDFVFAQREIPYQFTMEGSSYDFDYTKNGYASDLLYNELIVVNPAFDKEQQAFVFGDKVDPIASIFYVLTRMEEYSSSELDLHDRFTAKQSGLTKHNLLDKAICDRWAVQLLRKIGVAIPAQNTCFEPTFDIDNTYAYKYKSGMRRTLSIWKDRMKRNKVRLAERKAVEQGADDPYDTFESIEQIVRKYSGRIFWLVESNGKYDRNLSIEREEHKALIKRMSNAGAVGIHPSYKSFGSPSMIRKEKEKLGAIIGTEIENSRQHFLRFSLPESYRTLLQVGIKHDYTMGFADNVGFRAGTARSFYWYDLLLEQQTDLMVHPFVYMDGTLNEYLKLQPEAAKKKIDALFSEVEEYGGTFRFIWHNETIGEYNHWKGWKSVLDYTLSLHHE